MIEISYRKLALVFLGFFLFVGIDYVAQLASEFHDRASFQIQGAVALGVGYSLSAIVVGLGLLVITTTVFFVIEPLLPNTRWLRVGAPNT